jgi:hypothetical protein
VSDATAFGLWVGAGVTGSVIGLPWLHRARSPGRRVRIWPAAGSSPEGEMEERSRRGLRLESASDALDQ